MLQTHGSTSQSRIPMGLLLTSQIHLHLSLAVFLGSPWCQHLVQVSSSSPPLLSTLHLKPTFLLGGNLALRMEAAGFLSIGPLDLLFSGGFPLPSLPPLHLHPQAISTAFTIRSGSEASLAPPGK
ncbi:unnamed protein product [Brassica oleracea]